jgi:hypothetical protein
MTKRQMLRMLPPLQFALLLACGTEPAGRVLAPSSEERHDGGAEADLLHYDGSFESAMKAFSPWSEPVNAGPGVNSASQERSPALSPDKLSLYFTSDRPGGFGGIDMYVSRRDCLTCAFGPAVNLGPNLNSAVQEGTQQISRDGHLLLFSRLMPDGFEDILVSEREDEDDDFGWGPLKGLCPEINGLAAHQATPWLMAKRDKDGFNFYFSSRPSFAVGLRLWRASFDKNDDDPAYIGNCDNIEPATELNSPTVDARNDDGATIRKDGKEMFFWSGRASTLAGDPSRIWTSTRKKNGGAWSAPVPVGAPIDIEVAPEFFPKLSWDARTLVFGAGRLRGGSGVNDIWITERTPLDDDDDD